MIPDDWLMVNPTEQKEFLRRVALGTPTGFLAFGFGSGLSPYAPGTMGTLAAIPLAVLLYLCDVSSKRLGLHDPGGIVWDEMVAYWLTIAFIPVWWPWWLAAFVLFRAFDILKPWPIRYVENRFGGGLGIMLDDIVAALYAMGALALLQQFF
jgi:phosphatidylglycerophosphatase A